MSDSEQWTASSPLNALSAPTCAALLQLGTPREFGGGHVLFHEDERTTHVILLLSGIAKVTATTPEGGFALLSIRGAGEFVGELASLDDQPRVATVTTVNRVRARMLTQATFRGFLNSHPDAAVAISGSVGRKLRWATRRRVDFSGSEVRVRLARVLVELAAAHGRPTAEGVEVGVSLTQPELAALVGAAEPTVHKVLAALRRQRVLGTGYRTITILDLAALRTVADLGGY
jgi:CRP/FNR family transcriptional regulator, cyclic AMP receptor protein